MNPEMYAADLGSDDRPINKENGNYNFDVDDLA